MAISNTTVNGTPVPGLLQSITLGNKATAPTVTAPSNTLPKAQVASAPKDLSSQYGLSNGTVYDKNTNTGLSLDQFKQQSGIQNPDWNNLKFDTAYTPLKFGNAPASSSSQAQSQPQMQTPPPVTPPAPITPTTPNTGSYTPPNQGTTGVSQGGIIGNLIGIANNESPQVTNARANLQGLQNEYAQQDFNLAGNSGNLSTYGGRQGLLNTLFANKQASAQTALQNALTSQGQSITANQAAGGLNAPVVASPGQVVFNPSNPNPQGAGMLGVDSNTMNTYAQMLVSGQGSSIPSSITGNTALMAQLVNQAKAINPSFDINTAAGIGAANQQSAQTLGTIGAQNISTLSAQKNQIQSVLNGAEANFKLLVNTAQQGGVNDTSVPALNTLLNNLKVGLTSSAAVTNFMSTLATVRSQYASVLGGGSATVDSNQRAATAIPDDISLGALTSLEQQMKAEGVNRVNGIDQQIQSLGTSGGNSNTNPLGLPGF